MKRSVVEIGTWTHLEAKRDEMIKVFTDPKMGYGRQLGAKAAFRRAVEEYFRLFVERRGRGLQTYAGVKSKDQPLG